MLLADDLLLQVTLPDGRVLRPVSGTIGLGLAGAFLSELALAGRVGIDARGRLEMLDRSPFGDPALDAALAAFAAHQGKKPKNVLGKVAKGLKGRRYAALAAAGYVDERHSKVLGVIPRTRWVPHAGGPQEATRRALGEVILGTTPADARTGSLVSLLLAVGAVPTLFKDLDGLSGRELKRRAKVVAEGNWAGAAVSKAIAEVQAAVNAAVIGAVAASTAGAGAAGS